MPDQSLFSTLQKFQPIQLEEMVAVKLMNRVDVKYTFHRSQLVDILEELKDDYRMLEVNGIRLSSYESLYFDDNDLLFYSEHHRKRLNRVKVRYRRYLDSKISFLELKHKYKGRTNKIRIPSDKNYHELPEDHAQFLKENFPVEMPDLKATLNNQYKRLTLVNKFSEERLTIDLDLKFDWQGKEEDLSPIVIAELKQKRVTRNSPFVQVMKQRGIRPLRLSKYCIGILHLSGKENVKYNRFKKKLLKIDKIINNAA